MIGYYLHKHQRYFDNISDKMYMFALCLGLILSAVEQFFGTHTLYVGTPILVFAIIAFCGKNKDYVVKTYVGQYLSHIGSDTATYIYIMHMMIGNAVYAVLPRILPFDMEHPVCQWGYPFVALTAAIIGAEVICGAKRFLLTRR